MPKIALFVGGELDWFTTDFDYFVGVDRACLYLLELGLPLDLAVGDFDSVSELELDIIQSTAKSCKKASAEKNDTDTELALKLIFQAYPEAEVTIFGAFGGRIDHMLSNVFLVSDPQLAPFMDRICLRDKQNKITYCSEGKHEFLPEPDMTYISFLQEGDGELTILGAKYELTSMNYFQKKIYSSNEFVDGPIQVLVPNGYVIVIQTKDRS